MSALTALPTMMSRKLEDELEDVRNSETQKMSSNSSSNFLDVFFGRHQCGHVRVRGWTCPHFFTFLRDVQKMTEMSALAAQPTKKSRKSEDELVDELEDWHVRVLFTFLRDVQKMTANTDICHLRTRQSSNLSSNSSSNFLDVVSVEQPTRTSRLFSGRPLKK